MAARITREEPVVQSLIVELICLAALAVSAKSILVLGTHAPWTSAGWWLTIVYLVAVIVKVSAGIAIPFHAEYIVLIGLTLAFIVAGIRDERQAEPWWWPTQRGARRADKRGTGAER